MLHMKLILCTKIALQLLFKYLSLSHIGQVCLAFAESNHAFSMTFALGHFFFNHAYDIRNVDHVFLRAKKTTKTDRMT